MYASVPCATFDRAPEPQVVQPAWHFSAWSSSSLIQSDHTSTVRAEQNSNRSQPEPENSYRPPNKVGIWALTALARSIIHALAHARVVVHTPMTDIWNAQETRDRTDPRSKFQNAMQGWTIELQ